MDDEARTDELLEKLLAAAENHGKESEPAHEIGDLQEIIRACWLALRLGARDLVYDECRHIVEDRDTEV